MLGHLGFFRVGLSKLAEGLQKIGDVHGLHGFEVRQFTGGKLHRNLRPTTATLASRTSAMFVDQELFCGSNDRPPEVSAMAPGGLVLSVDLTSVDGGEQSQPDLVNHEGGLKIGVVGFTSDQSLREPAGVGLEEFPGDLLGVVITVRGSTEEQRDVVGVWNRQSFDFHAHTVPRGGDDATVEPGITATATAGIGSGGFWRFIWLAAEALRPSRPAC